MTRTRYNPSPMTRVLWIHDQPPDFLTQRTIAALQAGLSDQIISTTVPLPASTIGFLQATWKLRQYRQAVDVTHVFGLRALVAATLTRLPNVIYSPVVFPSPDQVRWLKSIHHHRPFSIIVSTSHAHRALLRAGLPPDRIRHIPPGVDFSRARKKRDTDLRNRLGFTDNQTVLLAIGSSTHAANHRHAAWAAAILNVLDGKTRLLLHDNNPIARSVRQFGKNLAQPELVTLASHKIPGIPFESLLSVADIAVLSADGPVEPLSIATALAAGLPIAATVTPIASELLEDRRNALLCPPRTPRLLAKKIAQLIDDPALANQLSQQSRLDAYDLFPQSKMLQAWETL